MTVKEKKYVYCSGPLFCPEEQGGMAAIASVLEEHGYGVFLPQRDGLEAFLLKYVNSPFNMNFLKARDLADRAIFAFDVYQIIEVCDYFVFNMNGRVPDEGGVVESALAFAMGKPVLLYKNDSRSAFNGRDNSMLTGLAAAQVSDINRIPAVIKKLEEKHPRFFCISKNLPSQVQGALRLGAVISSILGKIKVKPAAKKHSALLVKEIEEACRKSGVPGPVS